MNLSLLLQLALICLALWAAYKLLEKHGFWSLEFLLGGPAIVFVAWLILFSINTGMPQLKKQSGNVTNQFQGLASEALPAIISQPEGVSNDPTLGQNSNSPFNSGDASQNNQNNGGLPVFVAPTANAAPVVGDVSWAGSVSPSYNDQLLPYQASCFYNQQAQVTMFMNGYVPTGMTVSVVPISTFLSTPDKEKWEVRISYPHDQIPQQVYEVDGVTGRALKTALGGATVTGSDSWPLIQQTWDGAKNNITTPVVCEYR